MPLVIHWFPRSPECACRFQSVFDPESLPKTVKVVPEDLWTSQSVQSPEEWETVYTSWDKQSDLNIKSHGVFYKSERFETHLRALQPSSVVRDLLKQRTANVPWETAVGVHIRRTDNTRAIEGSPTELFLRSMRDLPTTFFVVATDDKDLREQIAKEFQGRCLFPALVLSRRSEQGMIHSAVDFFALSKCTKILGSYYSSFGDFASRYGQIPLTIVKETV